MKHADLKWNPETQEWFCPRCDRTSDHTLAEDARLEIEHVASLRRGTLTNGFHRLAHATEDDQFKSLHWFQFADDAPGKQVDVEAARDQAVHTTNNQ